MRKIDRKTVRKNPNYTGVYKVHGPTTVQQVQVSYRTDPETYAPIWERRVSVGTELSEDGLLLDGVLMSREWRECYECPADWYDSTSVQGHILPVYTLGRSNRYVFEYEPLAVTCADCGKSFPADRLSTSYLDDDLGSDRVCPECGCWDCCEVPPNEVLSDDELAEIALLNEQAPSEKNP